MATSTVLSLNTNCHDVISARKLCVACPAAMPAGQPTIKIELPRNSSLSANQSVSIFDISTIRIAPPTPASRWPNRMTE